MRPLRHKPLYNDLYLTYVDSDGYEHMFQASEISNDKRINMLIGMPTKDGGSRYITSADINFEIDCEIIQDEITHRIIALPEVKPIKDNNSRRGSYRKVKVIETS